jgi:probable phosphoglycerate mutase
MTGFSKHIYIIRHGETNYNKSGLLQGSTINSSLNESGTRQAKAFYNAYHHLAFDRIYSSALKRAIETASFFSSTGIPMEIYSELNEISWGLYEGRKLAQSDYDLLDGIMDEWRKGNTHISFPGGESPEDVAKRQQKVIDVILTRKNEKNILVVLHGRALRILVSLLVGTPLSEMDQYKHDNTALYVIGVQNDMLGSLIIKNDTSHLL